MRDSSILRPDIEVKESYLLALEVRSEQQAGWAALRDRPAVTADGTPVRLMLNVGLSLELEQLDVTGAEGIGLFRTEIAMLARGALTDTAEQAAVYGRVLDVAGDRPVLFRTLDLGGDKLLPGMELEEENPAMGWRSIRVGLDRPALLRRQLRALLLAAGGPPALRDVSDDRDRVRVSRRPVVAARRSEARSPGSRTALDRHHAGDSRADVAAAGAAGTDGLHFGGLQRPAPVPVRGRPECPWAVQPLRPALARRSCDLLEQLVGQASAAGVPVSLCGEAASRPLDALVLVGLGLTTLSMPATGILPVKAMLASVDLGAFRSVLRTIRRGAAGEPSLREPVAAWARDRGLPV